MWSDFSQPPRLNKVWGETIEFTCQYGLRCDYVQEYKLGGWFILFKPALDILSRISYKDGLGKPTSLVPGEIGCTCKTGWKG